MYVRKRITFKVILSLKTNNDRSDFTKEVSQKATPNSLPINPTPTIPNEPKVDTMKVRH